MNGTLCFYGKEDELHDQASKATGLTDFGAPDYLPGLRVLLASIDADARLTAGGAKLVWDALVITLVARAMTQKGWRDHPEYAQANIKRPIVITGVPRTGTTALHKLLAVDPQFQGFEHWLTTCPMPRPPREEWQSHPQYAQAVRFVEGVFENAPDFRIAHNVVVDELDECLEILRQSFVSNRWACTWTSPSYDAWWQTQSEASSYSRFADVMRLIGCHDSERRWLLKNPGHIGALNLLFDELPDAFVIQTHRDPVKAITSMSSTLFHLHSAFEGGGAKISAPLLGAREMEKWAAAVDAARPVRAQHCKQIIDVNHAEFHNAPMAVVGRIYDFCGLRLTAGVEAMMAERVRNKPELSHGAHNYDMADYGLRREEINARFADYIDEFGLAN
jgi:hypothetical protein